MRTWKRAWLYISRKKVRTVLLFFIFFLTGLFLLTGVCIRAAAKDASDGVKKTLPTGLEIMGKIDPTIYSFHTDENGATVRTLNAPLLTMDRLDELLDIDGVVGYYNGFGGEIYYTGLSVTPGFFSQPPTEEEIESDKKNGIKSGPVRSEIWSKCCAFYYVKDSKYQPFFQNGAMELVEGRHLTKEDFAKVLVSDVLARRNGLHIGDTVTAQNFDTIPEHAVYGDVFESEIVGIFKVNFTQKYSEYTTEEQIVENFIFADPAMFQWSVNEGRAHSGMEPLIYADNLLGRITLYVDDPQKLDSVKEEVLAMDGIEFDRYNLTYKDDDYKAVAKPLLTIEKLFSIFIAIVFIGSLIILSLVLSMWVKSRKREIGILTSVGIKNRSVLFQLLLECAVISVMAFLLAGIFSGPVVTYTGGMTSKFFSPSQTDTTYETIQSENSYEMNIYKAPTDPVVLEGTVTIPMILGIFAAILIIALCSTLFSSLRITDQKPRDILMK